MLDKRLVSIIKKLNGNLLAFEIDNKKIIDVIDSNNKITNCDLYNCWCEEDDSKGKSKRVFITSLRKRYKKKGNDYIIAFIDNMDKYFKTFIKDSIYINKKDIYLYTYNKEYDLDLIIKKYKRYNVNIEIINLKNGCILKISTSNAKNNRIKDFYYYVYDLLIDIIDSITDILIN